MKTIYYLGDQINEVWDEGDEAEVEITLTTLGREELTLTGFTGDLLEEIYFYVPVSDVNDDKIPTYDWRIPNQNPLYKEWKLGDEINGIANTGNEVKFPYVLNDDVPTLKVKLKLVIGKSESLPSHIYVETLELGDTSAILIFRSGINPEEPTFKPNLIFIDNSLSTDYPGTLSAVNYETNTSDIGSFKVKNIGGENGVITSIEFRDESWNIKDYMYFSGDTNQNDTATIASGMSEEFTIDVDARTEITNNQDAHFGQVNNFFDDIPSLSSNDDNFLRLNGYINVIYSDGEGGENSIDISVALKLNGPIIGYNYAENFLEEDQELKFNYKYSKVDHKVLNKKLKIYNLGNTSLTISDIDTNFSIDGIDSAIIYTTSGDITILPGYSHDFTFDITSLPTSAIELNASGSYLSSTEDLNAEFTRNLIISSNAMNYSNLGNNADRTLAYENNSGINIKSFISSVFYDYSQGTPYLWEIMDVDSFAPPILKPLFDSIAKIDIFNFDIGDSSPIPSNWYKLEVVEHNSDLGTTAWLNSGLFGEQSPSTQPLFIQSLDYYEQKRTILDDLATYVTVRLPGESDEDRYYAGEQEVLDNPKLEGHVRRKYDFERDINPFKILVTKVVQNSVTSEIDEIGTIDPKDQTTTYYDTNEKLLLYLYGRARLLTWDGYGLFNYNDTQMANFQSEGVNNFVSRKKGIIDLDSYGLFNYVTKGGVIEGIYGDTIRTLIEQIEVNIASYGVLNYNENILNSLLDSFSRVKQEGIINSFGLFNYQSNLDSIIIKDPEGVIQHEPDLLSENAYGLFNYNNKSIIFPDTNKAINYIKITDIHNPIEVLGYGLLNFAPIDDQDENQLLGIMDVEKIPNPTIRYSYGLLNYNENILNSLLDSSTTVEQYRPDLKIKNSYGLLNYKEFSAIGTLKATSWYGDGDYIGVFQFVDPTTRIKYANALLNYTTTTDISKIKGNYDVSSGKYGIDQYNPAYTIIYSYSIVNYYSKGGELSFAGIVPGDFSGVSNKKVPQDVEAYGIVNFNQDTFIYCLVEQAIPDFNVITTDGMMANSTTHNPGHTLNVGQFDLWITDKDTNFDDQNVNHLWKPSYPAYLSMSLYNNGNLDLTIHDIEIENNSPIRIYQLKVSEEQIEDGPFPMTITANSFLYSTFQLYVSSVAGSGVEDGYQSPGTANSIDDYYDYNTNSTHPILKIYTNDPNPDPSDPLHVIIDDLGDPHNGMAEWQIEVNWTTTWAENAQS